jgi:hypothetical protein
VNQETSKVTKYTWWEWACWKWFVFMNGPIYREILK